MTDSRKPGPIGYVASAIGDTTMTRRISSQPGYIGRIPVTATDSLTSRGEARYLTTSEIAMARALFKDSIDYSKVKVHNGEYLWFGMQPNDTAMTPNGEMYFNSSRFQENFAASSKSNQHWFMHEMVHVWQYQLGYPVKLRGAIRIGLSYEYVLSEDKTLADFNMEAQGDLLADYWAIKFQSQPPVMSQHKYRGNLVLFKKVLHGFLNDPSNKANLPGGK